MQKIVPNLWFDENAQKYNVIDPIILPEDALAFDLLTNSRGIDELLLLNANLF